MAFVAITWVKVPNLVTVKGTSSMFGRRENERGRDEMEGPIFLIWISIFVLKKSLSCLRDKN